MKAIELSNKVYLIRHWFVWYHVSRGGIKWDKLPPIIKNGKPKIATIESAAASLAKAKPVKVKPFKGLDK